MSLLEEVLMISLQISQGVGQIESLLGEALSTVVKAVGGNQGRILIVKNNQLHPIGCYNAAANSLGVEQICSNVTVAGQIAVERKPLHVDQRDHRFNAELERRNIAASIGVPLTTGPDSLIGVMEIGRADQAKFHSKSEKMMEQIARILAGALEARRQLSVLLETSAVLGQVQTLEDFHKVVNGLATALGETAITVSIRKDGGCQERISPPSDPFANPPSLDQSEIFPFAAINGGGQPLQGEVLVRSKRSMPPISKEVTFRMLTNLLGATLAKVLANYRLEESFQQTIRALSSALGAKDDYTLLHVKRVADLALLITRKMGRSDIEAVTVMAALVHDIGKIAVPDRILIKPGKLTPEEFTVIKNHPIAGQNIIGTFMPPEAIGLILGHHERLDGKGYPNGLGGNDLSLLALIAAVADVFDAMRSARPYRTFGIPLEEVLAYLYQNRGTQFQADSVDALLILAREGFPWDGQTMIWDGSLHLKS